VLSVSDSIKEILIQGWFHKGAVHYKLSALSYIEHGNKSSPKAYDSQQSRIPFVLSPCIPFYINTELRARLNITPLNPQSFACCAVTVPISMLFPDTVAG
jgi:hypothetical protein